MAQSIIIFEEEWPDNFYIRFESEHDTALNAIGIKKIGIIETMTIGSPFLMMNFFDGFGDLINLAYFSPDAEYNFYIGKSKEENVKVPVKLSMLEFENTIIGAPENVAFDLTFLSNHWNDLLKDTKSRSWKDKKYSEVVEEIIVEIGIEEYDIEPTADLFDIIQPDWTNYQMLKWLSENSKNEIGIAGYDFGFTTEGKFFFNTYNKMYSQKTEKKYTLSTVANDERPTFATLNFSNNYSGMLNQGGFGLNHTHFDYETKTFTTTKTKYSDSNVVQISDWNFISEEHETASKRFYGGRDINTKTTAENRISNIVNSFYKANIIIKGDMNLHIGDVISLEIPPSQFATRKAVINEKYSGTWLIQKVDHDLDFDTKVFSSRLTLVRTGMNGTRLKGFTKTTKGKVIS